MNQVMCGCLKKCLILSASPYWGASVTKQWTRSCKAGIAWADSFLSPGESDEALNTTQSIPMAWYTVFILSQELSQTSMWLTEVIIPYRSIPLLGRFNCQAMNLSLQSRYCLSWLVGWLVRFYGISTFVGWQIYFYTNNLFYNKQFSLAWVQSLIIKNISISSLFKQF